MVQPNRQNRLQLNQTTYIDQSVVAQARTNSTSFSTTIYAYSIFFILLFMSPFSLAIDKQQKVPGAGPSTLLVKEFFAKFQQKEEANGYQFTVPPRSVKHAGGIKASSHYLFGRTGRPLKESEKAKNKFEILLARIPLVFVTGRNVPPQRLTKAELEDIYSRKISDWSYLTGQKNKIVLVGREPTEAALNELVKVFPFLRDTDYDVIFKRDHQVVNYLNTEAGDFAIGFGAKPNLDLFNQISIEGVETGVPLGLVVDESRRNHEIVKSVITYAKSEEWRQKVLELGLVPL